MIVVASVIMAVNIRSFVDAGGLFPGGFNGLTLLIQRSAQQFCGLTLPFSLINFLLNAVPAVICFRLIGKRFTVYSCLSIVLTSVLTDLLPSMPLTNDVLLVSIFGGIVNGFAISLCLLGGATSGGTDFIAVAVSERLGVDAWNYILLGNAAMLAVAGLLFGWDKALYYYSRIWLPISLLTLPGGAVAFFAKKQNVTGAVILGIGNTIVALMGVSYFLKLYSAFPRHLLTVISCASIIVVLLLGMQKRWKTRILSAATTVLLTAGVIIWAVLNKRVI